MTNLEILKRINLGSSVAEEERKQLAQYFISTNAWEQLLHGDIDIVYGGKGTGKSALYLLLNDQRSLMLDKNVHIVQGENVSEDPVFKILDDQENITEQEFVTIWKFYILSLLGNYVRENSESLNLDRFQPILKKLEAAGLIPVQGLNRVLKVAMRYISSIKPEAQIGEAKYSISIHEPTIEEEERGIVSAQSLIKSLNEILSEEGKIIWVLFDRLDVAFTRPQTETPALRALFRVYRDLSGLENLRLKIFLRNDIWDRITKDEGFREQSHITKTLTIDWTVDALRYLVLSRFFANPAFESLSGLKKELALSRSQLQEAAMRFIFPLQVETGPKKSETFDWILKRVQDGKQNVAPREVIHMITTAKNEQIRLEETGSSSGGNYLLSATALRLALEKVSQKKVETFYSEYSNLRPYIESFKANKTEHNLATITEIFVAHGLKEEPYFIIKELLDIGFLQERKAADGQISYWIPFIFRPYLVMTQGTAFEKERIIE